MRTPKSRDSPVRFELTARVDQLDLLLLHRAVGAAILRTFSATASETSARRRPKRGSIRQYWAVAVFDGFLPSHGFPPASLRSLGTDQ
jgi:hypothetical protein